MSHADGVGKVPPVSVSKDYSQLGIGSTPYNPAAVQQQINAMLAEVSQGHPLSMAQINYVMSLCGVYRSDVVGNDAAELAQINKYLGIIQDITNQINRAADSSTSADSGTGVSGNPNDRLYADMAKLMRALTHSHFFVSGAGSSLVSQISGAIVNVLDSIFGPPITGAGGPSWNVTESALQQIWQEASGSPGPSGSPGTSGDPTRMNALNQATGALSQVYTSSSKASQAQIQADNSLLTAVNNAIASMEKKILEIISASVNAVTRS